MGKLQEVLEQEHALDLTGWHLLDARGISDDGLTIVGFGDSPTGHRQAWMARVPEAGRRLLMILSLGALRARRGYVPSLELAR